jgi:hypothetical protein
LESAEISLIAAQFPGKPGTPTRTSANKTSITVGWTAAAANGSAVTNYKIYYSVNSGALQTLNTSVGNVLTYTVNSLSTGNNYRFKVLAVNGVGDGPLSD